MGKVLSPPRYCNELVRFLVRDGVPDFKEHLSVPLGFSQKGLQSWAARWRLCTSRAYFPTAVFVIGWRAFWTALAAQGYMVLVQNLEAFRYCTFCSVHLVVLVVTCEFVTRLLVKSMNRRITGLVALDRVQLRAVASPSSSPCDLQLLLPCQRMSCIQVQLSTKHNVVAWGQPFLLRTCVFEVHCSNCPFTFLLLFNLSALGEGLHMSIVCAFTIPC